MSSPPSALAAVAARLLCPNCGAPLAHADRVLTCARGHSFDIARQGYVALLPPGHKVAPGDSPAMVDARERFLTAGHYSPIAEAVTAAARPLVGGPGCVADLGAGTGYHLAALLQELAEARGIALDASRPALRRAARAHPRIAAVACDVWQRLPIQDGAVDLVLDVFAPRNGAEIARVLAPHGALIVVTPTPDHLRELVSTLGLLDVDTDKEARVRAGLSPLTPVDRHDVEFDMTLGHDDVEALIAMGPSAHHVNADDVRRRVAELPGDLRVTASVTVQTFRRPA